MQLRQHNRIKNLNLRNQSRDPSEQRQTEYQKTWDLCIKKMITLILIESLRFGNRGWGLSCRRCREASARCNREPGGSAPFSPPIWSPNSLRIRITPGFGELPSFFSPLSLICYVFSLIMAEIEIASRRRSQRERRSLLEILQDSIWDFYI